VEYQTGNGHQSPKNTAFGQRIREDGLGTFGGDRPPHVLITDVDFGFSFEWF
jgi:hypothetical protein